MGKNLSTPLTTIRQPVFEMCELAVNILIKIVSMKPSFLKILKPELIVRDLY